MKISSIFFFKTPTVGRTLALLLASSAVLCAPRVWGQDEGTESQTALRESDVIRLALSRAPEAKAASAREKLATAKVKGAGLPSNPSFVWARESVNTGPSGGRGSQDLLGVSVPIEVARPKAARTLAESQGAWTRAESALTRTDGVLEAVLAYYDVAFAERRADVLSAAVSNLEEAGRILERREEAGSASGYERARLGIESELSQSHLAQAHAARRREAVRLAGLLGEPANRLNISADLSLMSRAREEALAEGGKPARKSLQLSQESERLAARASREAELTWFPQLDISGGLKRANNAGSPDGIGYFIGANVSLPFFDRGQGDRSQAEAERTLAVARSDALFRRIDLEIQTALVTFRQARDELERFDKATAGHVQQLLRAAQSGYREGQRTIVELVDAQRSQTDVALWRLNLLASAKEAEIRLRSAAGDLK